MTREEAFEILEESKRQNEVMRDNPSTFWASHQMAEGVKNAEKRIAALDLALAALRGPTREMVERMRGECGKCSMPENMALDAGGAHEFRISGDAIYYCDSEYGWEGEKISYCPWCGKPLTDEAVDMMLERWKEALGDET